MVCFFSVGLAHIFYILFNFLPLLQRKVNIYPIMGQGPGFPFIYIWIFGISGIIICEGYDAWRTQKLITHTYAVHHGDKEMLKEDYPAAIQAYELALEWSPYSVKANFNLGYLAEKDPDTRKWIDAVSYYFQSTAFRTYPYARLNAANVFNRYQIPDSAKAVLLRGLDRENALPELANNIALFYLAEQKGDSAIQWLKRGLRTNPDAATLFSNLGNVYREFDLPDEALTYFSSASTFSEVSPSILTNAYYAQIVSDSSWEMGDMLADSNQTYFTHYNQALRQLQTGEKPALSESRQLITESKGMYPEALLLDGYLLFEKDSILNALTRAQFLTDTRLGAAANLILGMQYYEKDAIGMARYLFDEAGRAGDNLGFVLASIMDIELGSSDSAFFSLGELRVKEDRLFELASKHRAMLQQANGQALAAEGDYPSAGFTFGELDADRDVCRQ